LQWNSWDRVSTTPGNPGNLLEFKKPGNPGNLLEFIVLLEIFV